MSRPAFSLNLLARNKEKPHHNAFSGLLLATITNCAMIVSLIRLHTRIETYVDKNVSFHIRLQSLDARNWPVEAVLVPKLFNQTQSHPVVSEHHLLVLTF